MTRQHASLLLLLVPVWPLLAAAVLSFGRRPSSAGDIAKIDREHRWVAASAVLISAGSLVAILLAGLLVIEVPEPVAITRWLVFVGEPDALIHFQLRMDVLSGPAALLAALLSLVAILAHRGDATNSQMAPLPYRTWMALLAAILIVLLANDLVLLLAALVMTEIICRSCLRTSLSLTRSLTMLAFLWIVAQWIVGFGASAVDEVSSTGLWLRMGAQQPIFTLVSGLCLLVGVMGRCGLYPFCIDVDRVYDETPGRLIWFGCLGSWIPSQYLLLRFWPVLGASPLGVPSMASLAVLLSMVSAWLAVTRPHRSGGLAMIGAGIIALTWTALGSGNVLGSMITATASFSLMLLFGSLVILCEASGWLKEEGPPLRQRGRCTLWVTLILMASGIGMQNAWEVLFDRAQQPLVEATPMAEAESDVATPGVPASLPMLVILAHGALWASAAFVLHRVLLGSRPHAAVEASSADREHATLLVANAELTHDASTDSPILAEAGQPPAGSANWLTRRLCGGLVVVALLWGPSGAHWLQCRGQSEAAHWLTLLTAAPWGVMLPAGWLGLVIGCWIGFAKARRHFPAGESWEKLADAGRRLFYVPEMARYLTWPLRQMLSVPMLLSASDAPAAEIMDEDTTCTLPEDEASAEATATAWLVPIAGLISVACIWSLLLLW